MLRSKSPVNAAHVIIGLLIVSGVITQCTLIPTALPTQSVEMRENTIAIAEVTQTATMTNIMSSATPTPDVPILPPGGLGAATNLQSMVECEEPGKAIAKLSWTPASSPGSIQRVDVTIYSFEGDQFEISKPLSPDQSSLVWEQLRGQAIHDWRVLTLQSNGWVPSETASFEGPTCVGKVSTPTPPIIP